MYTVHSFNEHIPSTLVQTSSGFRTEGIASSAGISLREHRDRTADEEIPSVRNPKPVAEITLFKKHTV